MLNLLDAAYSPNQFWLGNFVTDNHMNDIIQAEQQPKCHDKFIFPYTSQSSGTFAPLYTLEEQAVCQLMAHRGCIPATLLFGYSMTTDYEPSARVLCDVNSFQYMFLGIAALLYHHKDRGFYHELQFLYGNMLLYKMCHFLIANHARLGFNVDGHPVMEFCQDVVQEVEVPNTLDS